MLNDRMLSGELLKLLHSAFSIRPFSIGYMTRTSLK